MKKPILCLDFDGVICNNVSGWRGAGVVVDGVVPGAVAFIRDAVEHFEVVVHSARSGQPGGIVAMRAALRRWVYAEIDDSEEAARVFGLIGWAVEKPPAFLTIDDRAMTFTGVWPSIVALKAFKPWNK